MHRRPLSLTSRRKLSADIAMCRTTVMCGYRPCTEHTWDVRLACGLRSDVSRTRWPIASQILGLNDYCGAIRAKLFRAGSARRVAMGRAIVRKRRCSCSTSRSPTSMPSCGGDAHRDQGAAPAADDDFGLRDASTRSRR